MRTESRTLSSSASLFTARARSNSTSNGTTLEPFERAVVAHGHHVVEAVDADPLPPGVARAGGDRPSGMRVEELLDRGRPVLADVPRLGGEDDERVAVRGQDDVGVAVDDLETGHVRDRSLEARVLAAGDDQGIELVLGHRGPDDCVPPGQLCWSWCHEASTPLIRVVMTSFRGVGTPCSRPKRAMPPFRNSISVARRASTSWSIEALCP